MGDPTLISEGAPPAWSLLVGSAGRFAVILAAALYVLSLASWAFAGRNPRLAKIGAWAFSLASTALFGTFGCLAALFAANRFEYEYVWGHADTQTSLPYRIAGIWSGQEGSFLLWGVCAAIFGVAAARAAGEYRRWFTVVYSVFLGSICGILAFESPFALNIFEGRVVVPSEGFGIAPSLQNYWVTIHPPTIFLGFGALTVPFALAFAAMISRSYEGWIPIVRPWAIATLTLVGVGLCMGGFWAYETLGWGGFWMWDPVENTSFVPWCFMAAFVHGSMVQGTRKRWQISNLMLGALPFLTFMYGTFLTRSGVLADTSVHSFAEMDSSALRVLIGLLIVMAGPFLVLWTVRLVQWRRSVRTEKLATGVHREGFYRLGIGFLIGLGVMAMAGMSVPLAKALTGQAPSVVEEKTYHLVVPWLFVPLMILLALGPFASWRGAPLRDLARRAYTIFCLTVGILGLLLFSAALTSFSKFANLSPQINFPGGIKASGLVWMVILIGLCVVALVGNGWRMLELRRASKLGLAPFITHMGVAVLMLGLIASRGFERHEEALIMEGHPATVLDNVVKLKGLTSDLHDRHNKVEFEVFDARGGKAPLFTARPGLYMVRGADGHEDPMVWPHIQHYALHDVYFTLHPPTTETSNPVSLKPGQVMPLGGMSIKYVKMVREGEPGMAGTRFGAELQIESEGKVQTYTPKMVIGKDGEVAQLPADIGGNLKIALLSMDAADRSVSIQVLLATPMYPIEVYYKPLTILVWLGTFLMGLGGFLGVYYRRNRPRPERPTAKREADEARELVTA